MSSSPFRIDLCALWVCVLVWAGAFPATAQEDNLRIQSEQAHRLYAKGNDCYDANDHMCALECYKEALRLMEKSDSVGFRADLMTSIGIVYDYLGVYDKSMDYYQRSLALVKKTGDKKRMACVINNIGALYFFWKKYDTALEYYMWSMQIEQQLNNRSGLAGSYENIAIVYKNLGKTGEALIYFEKSIEINTDLKDSIGISTTFDNLGSLYLDRQEPEKARSVLQEALHIQQSIDDRLGICYSLIGLGQAYFDMGDPRMALSYTMDGIAASRDIGMKEELQTGYLLAAQIYEKTGDHKNALEYQKLYFGIKDSLFTELAQRQMLEMKVRYETEKKDREIEIARLKIERQRELLRKEQSIIISIVVIGLIILVFFVILLMLYLQKRRAYRVLMRQNLELVDQEKQLEMLRPEPVPDDQNLILEIPEPLPVEETPGKEKYSSSALTQEHKEYILNRIKHHMEVEKVYLDSQLTVETLASRMKTNRRYLSQVINEVFHLNFNQYINEYRVKEARRMLLDPSFAHLSIEGVAQSCGFNSRVSFITAFKKMTGLTPAYFQKTQMSIRNESI